MAKAQPKTVETTKSVSSFIKTIEDKQRQEDCLEIVKLMEAVSGFEPKMWGPAIIGFGSYHYRYESGHEGDAALAAFSPRKNEFALYFANFKGKDELLKTFGKHKTAKYCVYIKKVADIDTGIFKKLIKGSIRHIKEKYG